MQSTYIVVHYRFLTLIMYGTIILTINKRMNGLRGKSNIYMYSKSLEYASVYKR